MSNKPTPFARRLRKAIEDSGYDITNLGADCDISPTGIRGYLNHNVEPRVGNLKALCEHLGVSADYLIWGEKPYERDERR